MKALRLATLCLLLLTWSSSCGGSSGGGSSEPPVLPNGAPVMTVPANLVGQSPRYTFSLPTAGTQTLTFTATDPEGDSLLWQLNGPPAAAAGLVYTTPVPGSTFVLEVQPVLAPAFVQTNLLVDDGHGNAAAIDLLVVRTGPPAITAVTPDSAFRNHAQRVTINGSALQLGGTVNTTVGFDGFAAANVVVANDTTLTCSTPTSALIGGTIVGVAHQFGQAQLAESAFTMFEFPPAFAAQDQRLDSNTVVDFQLGLRGATAHAVWQEGNAIVHRVSNDGGATWAPQQTLSGTQVATEPQLVVTQNLVTVGWIAGGNQVWVRRFAEGSTEFLPAQQLDVVMPPPQARRLRLSQSGDYCYAAWLSGDPGVGAARVVATGSTDLGASWSEPRTVSDGLANQSNHELSCAGAVAWILVEDERLGAAVRGIYAVRTTDAGGTWGQAKRLNLATAAGSQPRLAAASGRVHACWIQSDALLFNTSSNNGLSWNSVATTVQGAQGGAVSAPSICGEADRVFMSYVKAGNIVWVSRFSPLGSVVQHVQVDNAATPSAQPGIGCIGNYVFVAWREGDPATGAARAKHAVSVDVGATFTAPAGLGDGTANQDQVQLRHDGARLLLGWLDSRAANVGLFINCTAQ